MRNGGFGHVQQIRNVTYAQFFFEQSGYYARSGRIAENFEQFRYFVQHFFVRQYVFDVLDYVAVNMLTFALFVVYRCLFFRHGCLPPVTSRHYRR